MTQEMVDRVKELIGKIEKLHDPNAKKPETFAQACAVKEVEDKWVKELNGIMRRLTRDEKYEIGLTAEPIKTESRDR